MPASTASAPSPPRRGLRAIRRTGQDARIGGICAGIARAWDVDPRLVRIAVIVLAVATAGTVLGAYLLAWALLPADADAPPGPESLGWRTALGAGMVAAAVVVALQELGAAPGDAGVVWPVLLTTAGLVLLRRAAGPASAAELAATPAVRSPEGAPPPVAGTGRTAALRELPSLGPRTLAGAALVAAGLVALLQATDAIGTIRDVVVAGAIVLAGVTLIFGTSWLGLLETLREERAQRIRSEERAEMAAHLHDSVLQTLALIQRQAGDDREVAALARRQERELRDWLAGRAQDGAAETLTEALREAAADVEDAHGVTVEVVTVGDAPLDEDSAAVVRAATEAAVNAAKFAGTGRVDVFAEVTGDRIEVFVRDRGPGFDPAAVPADRRGLRESIAGRMARHGGRAEVRSAPGEGTEVELVLDRSGAAAR